MITTYGLLLVAAFSALAGFGAALLWLYLDTKDFD
jgi:hypothetical protein